MRGIVYFIEGELEKIMNLFLWVQEGLSRSHQLYSGAFPSFPFFFAMKIVKGYSRELYLNVLLFHVFDDVYHEELKLILHLKTYTYSHKLCLNIQRRFSSSFW